MYRFVRTIKALLIPSGSDQDGKHKASPIEISRQFLCPTQVNMGHDKAPYMFGNGKYYVYFVLEESWENKKL